MRDNWASNRIVSGYDNLVDHCCRAGNKLVAQPWTMMSIRSGTNCRVAEAHGPRSAAERWIGGTERARLFAAEIGLQAFALIAAAEGAVSAYAHSAGENWQPYEPPPPPSTATARQSAAAELAAIG